MQLSIYIVLFRETVTPLMRKCADEYRFHIVHIVTARNRNEILLIELGYTG